MSKEEFKIFAQKHKELGQLVLEGKTTWQKLYELYDIYGEDNSIWNNLDIKKENVNIKDIFSKVGNIDLESIQKGIESIQQVLSLFQGIGKDKKQEEPKPIYKYFED